MHVKVERKNYLEKEWNLLIDNENDVFNFFKDHLSSGISYWDIDSNGKKWFNSKFWGLLGYRNTEAKHTIHDWGIVVHPDDIIIWEEKIEKHLKSPKRPFSLIVRFFHKNGSIIWLNCIGKAIHPNRLLFIFQDISENKRQEEKFVKRENAFIQMNQVTKIGHWELDIINNEMHWSDYCKIIHEVPLEFNPDIINSINFYKEGVNRDRITRLVDNCLKYGIAWDEELQIVTATNKVIWIRVIGKAYFENEVFQRIFGVIQDIDRQKKSEMALRESEAKFRNIVENNINNK